MSETIGSIGEDLVANWLQTQNYTIIDRNWSCRLGELDLIAHAPNQTIALIEVKTRSIHNWDIDGLLAITPTKQRKLWKTAELFILKHPQYADQQFRFDVALVSHRTQPASDKLYQIHHQNEYFDLHTYIEDAFSG